MKFLHERAVMCRSCAGVFMIVAEGKRICSHIKAELKIDDKTKVSCSLKCLRTTISRHIYILLPTAMFFYFHLAYSNLFLLPFSPKKRHT